ncbi:hypothetical protein [Dyadobacter crusticola]|uniref:hypothetical protein n=1 Tax=Dyadobacter crusticola TaxID=292407 RepID=UPI000AC37C37|nr:hypothetical protein [Dyadobacter crusticola]
MPQQINHEKSFVHATALYFFILLFTTIMTSCDQQRADENAIKRYFDLKGFVENQIVYLNEKKPEAMKSAKLDGELQTVKSRDIDWKKELELFIQADINKPSYAQSYNVVRKDSSTYEYRLRENADLPVRYLKIVTDSTIQSPVKVLAVLQSHNRIYESEKQIELTCIEKDNLWQVSAYSVKGYQKLIFMEPKHFEISSRIGL